MDQKEACVILGRNEDELLIFGRIVDVYIIKSRVLLEISVLETIEFNEHFHAFVVCERNSPNMFVWPFDLCDYRLYKQPIIIY